MKKKIIQLPRGYISYSQIQLWQNDPLRYKQIYFDDRQELQTSNSGQEYGKVVADALEHSTFTGDLLTDTAMELLPKYDVADEEIRADLHAKDGWITVLGKPDSLDSDSKNFLEYKTGKTPWTQKKAQNHLQMKFYAMLIFLKWKVSLREARLVWIETEKTPEGIKPTGRIENFRVVFTLSDILATMALTTKIAKEIEIAYAMHVPDPRLAWDYQPKLL